MAYHHSLHLRLNRNECLLFIQILAALDGGESHEGVRDPVSLLRIWTAQASVFPQRRPQANTLIFAFASRKASCPGWGFQMGESQSRNSCMHL